MLVLEGVVAALLVLPGRAIRYHPPEYVSAMSWCSGGSVDVDVVVVEGGLVAEVGDTDEGE